MGSAVSSPEGRDPVAAATSASRPVHQELVASGEGDRGGNFREGEVADFDAEGQGDEDNSLSTSVVGALGGNVRNENLHAQARGSPPRHNLWELLFYTHVEDTGGTRSALQLCLNPESVFFAQMLILCLLCIVNATFLLVANEEAANWLFVYLINLAMCYDLYQQMVLVSIRLFNYRPSVRKLRQIRALKRTTLVMLVIVTFAFIIKGRGDAGVEVPVMFAVNMMIFVIFYGWFSQTAQCFVPFVSISELWCFREAMSNRAPLMLRSGAKPDLISKAEIDDLPSERFRSASFKEQVRGPAPDCAICLELLVYGEVVNPLPCGHCFHAACMRTWLLRKDNPTCPTCRQDVRGTANEIELPL